MGLPGGFLIVGAPSPSEQEDACDNGNYGETGSGQGDISF
jgi:hypothetical protein